MRVCVDVWTREDCDGGRWRERQQERGVYVSGCVCPCVNALTERHREGVIGGEGRKGKKERKRQERRYLCLFPVDKWESKEREMFCLKGKCV